MLNNQDIKKLKSVFATKDDFKHIATKKDADKSVSNSEGRMLKVLASKQEIKELKNDIDDLRELVQGLIISSDSLVKSMGELRLEYAAISTQLSRHERWIKEIAEKVGLKLVME
jgi:hypothetical protein